jgi:two-component system OmpR family response regulator
MEKPVQTSQQVPRKFSGSAARLARMSNPAVSKNSARILVVDDEESIRFLLKTALGHFGFEVQTAASGLEAIELAGRFVPDLIVLDVMMPDRNGFDVIKRLRSEGSDVPVLFLTARDSAEDRVHGFTLGADDYVTKPFSLEEVVARVNAILRRVGKKHSESKLRYADLTLDDDAHLVARAGHPIELSPTEYKLLRYLMANAGRVLSRAQILDHVWNYEFDGEATVVESYVSYLRKKVDTLGPPLIKTVRGVGYCLREG